ncbi:MAG: T9SS type A sorting domain-containing protein [Flavobacteriales bacterium]
MKRISKLKLVTVCSILALSQTFLFAQSGTMYGLYRQMTPPSVSLVSFDVNTGAVTPIGNQVLSTTINLSGVSLNPYNFSYNYQDGDSWLSLSLLDGSILSDVTVTLPNANGDFNNFRFNAADSIMYGLYSQVVYNPTTGTYSGDMRLASCELSTGVVSLISPTSITSNYTMAGSAINPHLMVYYFITEGKLRGLDLYNGTIYSDPLISIPSGGNSFDNFAYSCADTTMYGLIMQNGVKCLGKIDATTGIVTPLPTLLNLDNYIMNAATIDPVNAVYYFESMVGNDVQLIGLSLLDGSIVSSASIPNGFYFDMFKMDSDCFEAAAIRPNPSASIAIENNLDFSIFPNPVSDVLKINCIDKIDQIEIFNLHGMSIGIYRPDQPEFSIQTAQFTQGFYTIKAQVGGQSVIKSFIKE